MIEKAVLKEIVLQQNTRLKQDLGILREKPLKPLKRFATIVSGVRRCGKSTYVRQFLQNSLEDIKFVHFEDIRLSNFDKDDFIRLEEVLHELYPKSSIFFFDEIQNITGWEIYVRQLIDSQAKVYITGSNATMFSKNLGTRLTGRYIREELFPFSFSEFCLAKGFSESKDSFLAYLETGGFPEFVIQEDPRILELLLDDIIYRDILTRSKIDDEKLVRELLSYLISNSGKLFSYSSLKKLFNIGSVSTISILLSALEDSYVVFQVPQYSSSLKKQIRNPKKIYSIDTGFVSKISFQHSPNYGRLLENLVFITLKKRFKHVYYHRSDSLECDFVVTQGFSVSKAIQVCYVLHSDNRQREYAGLLDALHMYNLSEGLLLTFDEDDELVFDGKKIILKPVWKWLLELS